MNQQHDPPAGRRLNAKRLAIVALALMLGILLWARVIVIERMPRLAVAEDESELVTPDATAGPSAIDRDRHDRD